METNNSLEITKQLVKDGKISQEIAQTIFPELAESEDERIRRTFIQLVYDAWDGRPTAEVSDERVYNACLAYLEKQKEQKSAECELEDAFKYYTDAGITVSCGDFVAKPKEQKPAEWSEEDEITIADLINYFEGDSLECSTEEMVRRIKSLRPQPHWKPNEKEIIAFENLLKGEFPDKIFPGATLSGLLGKLKMLYYNAAIPYWKPSEEQMKHLKRCFSHGHTSQLPNQHILESLYNDLKRL